MPEAVGVIQTIGFPGILAAADTMVKAAAVTLVYYDLAESGHFYIAIRGKVAEVKSAMVAGIKAVENVYGATLVTHYIVPNPPENVVEVLPIHYTETSESFRL